MSVAFSTDLELDRLSINTIRLLCVDAVQKAKSGHPGMPMGCAPMAYVLWTRMMKHNPADPLWPDRDRFILSAGHGSMLLYAMLHLCGYEMPMSELKQFRQWGSKTPGHPEHFLADGIETTTGPLGQGFATGVGMAIAEKHIAARFNRPGLDVVNHFTYAIVSDGEMMEGVTHEAAALAGHLGLGKLIYLYDDNHISIDGSTDLSFSEDVCKRFEAYNWHVQRVTDGNDVEGIAAAVTAAQVETQRPSLIAVRTTIGFGSPAKAGTASVHGEPLGTDEVRATKRNLGWDEDRDFYVPDAVYASMTQAERGRKAQESWNDLIRAYHEQYPEDAATLKAWLSGTLPDGWDQDFPEFPAGEGVATRASGGKVLGAIASKVDWLIGGSADLTPSNKTDVKGRKDFQKDTPEGQYLRFGVREHGMAAACNGIALHGGLRPYCGTFFVFSDYLRPALRLSAIMGAPVIYVLTHDSIGVGEDGPTHQPIEHLMSLRVMPNVVVLRPADAGETAEAWRFAMQHTTGPVVLLLTRQNLPTIDRAVNAPASQTVRGAYVVNDSDGPLDLIMMASGSEVQHIMKAADVLRAEGKRIRVVSMPSWELFEQQDAAYRESVLPGAVRNRLAVEAGVTTGWHKYVGLDGRTIGIDRFGMSAPVNVVMEKFGFTAENVLQQAREMLS